MTLKSLSLFSSSPEYAQLAQSSGSPLSATPEKRNADSSSTQGCFSFLRKLFWRAPEKIPEKQAPKDISDQSEIDFTSLSKMFENALQGKTRGNSPGLLDHHFGKDDAIELKLEIDEPYEDSLLGTDESSESEDDCSLDRYLSSLPTPSPPKISPTSIHPDAEKNLRKYFSHDDMLRLENALHYLSAHKAGAKALDEPQLVKCRSVNSPRSLLVLPTGDVYLLFNRKMAGDRLLGKGAFKNVYRAINLETGEKAAYISAEIDASYDCQTKDAFKKEYEAYQENHYIACHSVANSYFVKHVKFSSKQSSCYLVQRMKGDLWHGIRKGHIDLSKRAVRIDIAQQIATLLNQYHQQHRLHRDLKPDNLLYTIVDGRVIVKLSDFGLSTALNGTPVEGLGTPMYRAPEDCPTDSRNGSYKSDSFQFGMTLAILFESYLSHQYGATEEFREYLRIVTEITRKCNDSLHHGAELIQMLAFQARWNNKTLTQEQWMNKPENENSIEYVIYKLLQIDPTERWTPSQAAEALFFMETFG
jgi:serine/threonine protein kinase